MQHSITNYNGSLKIEDENSSFTQSGNLPSEDKEPSMSSPESAPQSLVISRERMFLWHTGILGYVSVRTRSKFVDDIHNTHTVDKRFVSQERIIIFRPSFWKVQLELHFASTCDRISRTLSTDYVIDLKAQVFEMSRTGDVQGLKEAYYNGSISLNVVDPLGMGLLHVSIIARPYARHLKVDSMPQVAFRKTCVLGFSVWAWVLIVQISWASM